MQGKLDCGNTDCGNTTTLPVSSWQGADANRNYGHHWNEGGSSNDRCSDTYHGPEAWSEVENVHVSNYIMTRQKDWIFYNSIHSYSQLVLLPWGYTNTLPDDYNEMLEIALRGEAALEAVHGKTYDVGCIPLHALHCQRQLH